MLTRIPNSEVDQTKMARMILLIASILFSGSVGFVLEPRRLQDGDGRIVGGFDAAEGQFPYQISIRHAANGNHNCGGSILNSRWILTAAHCVPDASPSSWFIVAGTINRISGGQIRQLSRIILHEDYTLFPVMNDIALLELQQDLEFSSVIQPIELESEHNDQARAAVVSGWGLLFSGGSLPERLQYLPVNVLTTQACQSAWSSSLVDQSMVCTLGQQAGQGVCSADSGGPLVADGKQIGVVSWGGSPCAGGRPDVYARVSSFGNWIEAAMRS